MSVPEHAGGPPPVWGRASGCDQRCLISAAGTPGSLDDLGDVAGADGAATLADGELQALFQGDRVDQLHLHVGVVTGHDHVDTLRQLDGAGDVGGAEVELRGVVREERLVTATLVLVQDVDAALELGVRGDRARLADDHAALHVFLLGATQQQADVLTGLALVEQLAEHLDTGDRGGLGGVVDADDLDGLVDLDHTALDPAGDDRATTGDGEDVLDRHEERLLGLAGRGRDVLVDRVHQVLDGLDPLGVALEGLVGGDLDDRAVLVELLRSQQLADLHLDELDELGVVDHVALVQRHDDGRHAHLAGEQHVLAGLRHRAVGRGHDQNGAVHLSGTRDHVLDVVSVTGAVNVRVVALLGLVLDVRDRDRDTALALLGSLVDGVEGRLLVEVRVLVVEHLRDRRGQSGLAVVDVPDGADVDVRLGPLELGLCHWGSFLMVASLVARQALITTGLTLSPGLPRVTRPSFLHRRRIVKPGLYYPVHPMRRRSEVQAITRRRGPSG
ncbi:hypothetical protein SDC9_71619 [bioreactor metagenome]|uniref:NAD-specific glutamate dehydrogenase n=1 Tax=bioreactor metagenome TaxID=1076179 RepID=A0A644Y9Z2_9ZZZZ